MTRLIALLFASLLVVAACESKKDESSGTNEEETSEGAEKGSGSEAGGEDGEKDATDWIERALKPVEATVDGVDFTVALPDGLEQEVKKAEGAVPGYVNWTVPGTFEGPSFTAQRVDFPPTDLAGAKRKLVSGGKYEPVVEEKLDDGFLVVVREPSGKYLHAQVWRPAGEKVLRFSVMQRTSEPIENSEAVQKRMVEVLRSFDVAVGGE